jgi:hypothetical protein
VWVESLDKDVQQGRGAVALRPIHQRGEARIGFDTLSRIDLCLRVDFS